MVRTQRSQDDADLHETKLGPNVIAGVKELKDHLQWSNATVMLNNGVTLDGSVRLLHLTVADHVDMLYGRRMKSVPDQVRWIYSYTLPGQYVVVRSLPEKESGGNMDASRHLYSIANSPYQSRRDSAYVDASIIEIVAERNGSENDRRLCDLAPGSEVEVSQVVGRGFASLFNSYVGLQSALEEGRNILMIGVGTRGMTPLRAVLNWTPVQAHATAHRVTCLYVAKCPSKAAFLTEWDLWREAGVQFKPLYTEPGSSTSSQDDEAVAAQSPSPSASQEDQQTVLELLEGALFLGPGGFDGIAGGRASECVVLLAGVNGELASKLSKYMTQRGVPHERILFCDYF